MATVILCDTGGLRRRSLRVHRLDIFDNRGGGRGSGGRRSVRSFTGVMKVVCKLDMMDWLAGWAGGQVID